MLMMNNLLGFMGLLVLIGAVMLGMTCAPYRGVICLMLVSFFCCVFMIMLGRTFAALMMYIVYLGGLVVVFGYCVSVESGSRGIFEFGGVKYFVVLVVVGFSLYLVGVVVMGYGGLLVYPGWGSMVGMELNGAGVLYSAGGVGLVICSWALFMVLFSILVILGWGRLGSLRLF